MQYDVLIHGYTQNLYAGIVCILSYKKNALLPYRLTQFHYSASLSAVTNTCVLSIYDDEKDSQYIILPFDYNGHANVLLIRPLSLDVEIFDPIGVECGWISPQQTEKILVQVLCEELCIDSVYIKYPKGDHIQQKQIIQSSMDDNKTTDDVHFTQSLRDGGTAHGIKWHDKMCLFWTSFVLLVWYCVPTSISLHTVSRTLIQIVEENHLSYARIILPFATYLTRVVKRLLTVTDRYPYQRFNQASYSERVAKIHGAMAEELLPPLISNIVQQEYDGKQWGKQLSQAVLSSVCL